MGELDGFSTQVCHSEGWRSLLFFFIPEFVARTQNHSVPDDRFGGFSVPCLHHFADNDSDEMDFVSGLGYSALFQKNAVI